MFMSVDLHIHSTGSDGTLTPSQVVTRALERGMTAIAIADHDSVSGIAEGVKAGTEHHLDVFPALEISTEHDGRELHLLGYLIDPECPELLEVLAQVRASRWQRGEEMVHKLQALGIPLDFEAVKGLANGESFGRPHIATALVECGAVNHPQEAFDRYLRRGRPAYVERYRHPAEESVQLVRRAGGLPVIAHPGLLNHDSAIGDLLRVGLGGLEAIHTDHTSRQIGHYTQMAERLGLIVTGGSDSHGPKGPKPVDIGQGEVPDSCAEALREWGREHGRWPLTATS